MKEKRCGNCANFRQHYVLSAGDYMPLHYGHCAARRHKKLDEDTEGCERFAEKEEAPRPVRRYILRIEVVQV